MTTPLEKRALELLALRSGRFSLPKHPFFRHTPAAKTNGREGLSRAQKIQLGLSTLGTAIGVSSYVESHRNRKQGEKLGKIDQQSLKALESIHSALQDKSSQPTQVVLVAPSKKALGTTLSALHLDKKYD